jgi:hypothetical protein
MARNLHRQSVGQAGRSRFRRSASKATDRCSVDIPGRATRHLRCLPFDETLPRRLALRPLLARHLLTMYVVIQFFLLLNVKSEGVSLRRALGY